VPDDAQALSTFLSHIYLSTYAPHFGAENIARHFQPLLTVENMLKTIESLDQTVHLAIAAPDAVPPSGPIVGLIQTREEAIPTQYLFPASLEALGPVADGTGAGATAPDKAGAYAYVARLYVHEIAHGTGLARTLLALAEGKVVELGYRRIWLKVLGSNLRAVRFYEKSAYALVGEQVVTEKDEDEGGHWAPRRDLVMVKRLGSA